jgi:hypothetical protein
MRERMSHSCHPAKSGSAEVQTKIVRNCSDRWRSSAQRARQQQHSLPTEVGNYVRQGLLPNLTEKNTEVEKPLKRLSVRVGSVASHPDVRDAPGMSALPPKATQSVRRNEASRCAIRRHMRCSKPQCYSIT